MKYLTLVFVSFLAFAFTNVQKIDSKQSGVSFQVSNMKFNTVEGTFKNMQGDITFDAKNLDAATFEACIDAATVKTGNGVRDGHLLKSDFFDVLKYPKICFQSEKIKKTKDGYKASGKLTMKGITRAVAIPFTYENTRFKGRLKLTRQDFKIGDNYGSFTIGDEITIDIDCKLE